MPKSSGVRSAATFTLNVVSWRQLAVEAEVERAPRHEVPRQQIDVAAERGFAPQPQVPPSAAGTAPPPPICQYDAPGTCRRDVARHAASAEHLHLLRQLDEQLARHVVLRVRRGDARAVDVLPPGIAPVGGVSARTGFAILRSARPYRSRVVPAHAHGTSRSRSPPRCGCVSIDGPAEPELHAAERARAGVARQVPRRESREIRIDVGLDGVHAAEHPHARPDVVFGRQRTPTRDRAADRSWPESLPERSARY